MQSDQKRANLGSPSLAIAGFQLWIHSREFPHAHDYFDGNWLNSTAHCGGSGADIWVTGAILTTMDLELFADRCQSVYDKLAGEAMLRPWEPGLQLTLRTTDNLGHLQLLVELTPDHMTQSHAMKFTIDQSYLPHLISQCRLILDEYPVRAKPQKDDESKKI